MESKCRYLVIGDNIVEQLHGRVARPQALCALKKNDYNARDLINNAYKNESGLRVGSSQSCFYYLNENIGCRKCPKYGKPD